MKTIPQVYTPVWPCGLPIHSHTSSSGGAPDGTNCPQGLSLKEIPFTLGSLVKCSSEHDQICLKVCLWPFPLATARAARGPLGGSPTLYSDTCVSGWSERPAWSSKQSGVDQILVTGNQGKSVSRSSCAPWTSHTAQKSWADEVQWHGARNLPGAGHKCLQVEAMQEAHAALCTQHQLTGLGQVADGVVQTAAGLALHGSKYQHLCCELKFKELPAVPVR